MSQYEVVKRKLAAVEALSQLTDKHELELELFDLWDTANEGHLSFEVLPMSAQTLVRHIQCLTSGAGWMMGLFEVYRTGHC